MFKWLEKRKEQQKKDYEECLKRKKKIDNCDHSEIAIYGTTVLGRFHCLKCKGSIDWKFMFADEIIGYELKITKIVKENKNEA